MTLHPEIRVRPATRADLKLVARMNKELIEDEGHRNPMTVDQLEQRAAGFMDESGWRIDLFEQAGSVVGYATWKLEDDNTEPSGKRVYLRQFYVALESRGGGVGRQALNALMGREFPADTRVLLEVMQSNPGGQQFWSRMGFAPYSHLLESRSVNSPRSK